MKVIKERDVHVSVLVDHASALVGRVWEVIHRGGHKGDGLDMLAAISALVQLLGRLSLLVSQAPGVDWNVFRADLFNVLKHARVPEGTALAFENLVASMPVMRGEALAAMLLACAVNRSATAYDGAAALAAAAARYHELAVDQELPPYQAPDLDEQLAARANEFLTAMREGKTCSQAGFGAARALKVNATGGDA